MNSKDINTMFVDITSHLRILLEDTNMLIKIETIPLNTLFWILLFLILILPFFNYFERTGTPDL